MNVKMQGFEAEIGTLEVETTPAEVSNSNGRYQTTALSKGWMLDGTEA